MLKTRFYDGLSLPQQVALKIMYGAPLSAKITDDLGWSELDYWTAFQGGGIYDDLGYLKEVPVIFPYSPQSYREVWGIFGRRSGKALAIDTPMLTRDGWRALKELKEGDQLVAKDGTWATVTFITPVMYDHECYEVSFSDGAVLIADGEHKWEVCDDQELRIVTTKDLHEAPRGWAVNTSAPLDVVPVRTRFITDVRPVASVPVRCLQIDHPSHVFLAGEALVPTHNTDSVVSTAVAYEAACGGHEAYLRAGQRGIVFQIAQDLRMARYSLHFIRAAMETSPLLRKMITNVTADRLDLDNGMTIASVPPTLKSVRGFASPVASLDEVGVWYQDSDSANPDYEIYRAMSPGQLQFPNRLIIGTSSPWNKAGLLYRYYEAGTGGRKLRSDLARTEFQDVLVLHGPTALMGNPHVQASFLKQERARDPEAFARECLAEFQDSISGFIPVTLVERAVDHGIELRKALPGVHYVAALDPAFRRDAFAFTIFHADGQQIIQDVALRFKPEHDEVLSPEGVLDTIAPICRAYGTKLVFTDQYQLESLTQLARHKGLELHGLPFTSENKARLYGSLQQLFYQDAIRLLDHPECVKELKSLERELTGGGHVIIKAPSGMHDDMASVTVLAVSQAIHYRDRAEIRKKTEVEKPITLQDRCNAHMIAKKRTVRGGMFWD